MTFLYFMRFCWGGGGKNLKVKFAKNTNYRDGFMIVCVSRSTNYHDVFATRYLIENLNIQLPNVLMQGILKIISKIQRDIATYFTFRGLFHFEH